MTKLTILNSMAGQDFEQALENHQAWGLRVLDLKDSIFGKMLIDLTDEEAGRAAEMIKARDLETYCFSSVLFHPAVEQGESSFRENELGKVGRLIEIARILKPKVIRLLAPQTKKRAEITDGIEYLKQEHPWLIPMFQEAVDRIHAAGFHVTIENEVNCILSKPGEVLDFFAELNRPGKVNFTWDVQNFWQSGTFPTVEVYKQLKPLIDYYHVKGGQHDDTSLDLCWRTALEDASWPVLEITRRVIADGISPVICLNPSHGKEKPEYDQTNLTKRNIDFLRREIAGIE